MNNEEIQSLIEQLKAQGLSEEEIMNVFYETFTQGKMDRKDLETLANAMGYELTDDFKNDETPDPIADLGDGGEEAVEGTDGMTEEDLKDPLDINEDKEDGEKEDDDGEDEEPEEKGDEDEPEESEDEEWEKAQKMFKI